MREVTRQAGPEEDMRLHFSKLAPRYRELRATDVDLIDHIRRRLAGRTTVRAADIGCGDGRDDRLLAEHLPGLELTCIDPVQPMLERTASLLRASGFVAFNCVNSSVEDLTLPARAFDCVFTSNAIHHFDLALFLRKAGAALREGGRLFVYTRLPSQNARTIWGRYFPHFAERETRLYSFDQLDEAAGRCDSLVLESATHFRYQRTASLERLCEQASLHHYSTFTFYEPIEFEDSLREFERRIRLAFADPDQVTWHDENVLLEFRRQETEGGNHTR